MADTYTLISSVTVGAGGASSFGFSSIPATYTDLCIILSVRDTNAQTYGAFNWQYNNSGGTAYSYRNLQGNGSSATSGNQSGLDSIYMPYSTVGANATTNTFNNMRIYIPNYAGSTYKSSSAESVTENNATEAISYIHAGLWANTSAINSITFYTGGSGANFVQYSTAYLYGIKNS